MRLYECLAKEDEDTYHAKRARYLTSHGLQTFLRSPRLLQLERERPELRHETVDMRFGRAFHCLLLEPDEFADRYAIVNTTGTRAGSKRYQERVSGIGERTPINEDQYAAMSLMVASVKAHAVATEILAGVGTAEGVLRQVLYGAECQIRVDWSGADHFVDVKTCYDIDAFEGQIEEYRYDHQVAFYSQVVDVAIGYAKAYLVAVEKAPAHRCGVWRISPLRLARCKEANAAGIERYADCMRKNEWPTGYEGLKTWG